MQNSGKGKVAGVTMLIARCASILAILGAFFAAFNPAKLCGYVNKNASVFTIAVSYKTLRKWFAYALKTTVTVTEQVNGVEQTVTKPWVQQSAVTVMYIMCLGMMIGLIFVAAGWCMSIGELRMKRFATMMMSFGSVVTLGFMALAFPIRNILWTSPKLTKVQPVQSAVTTGFIFYMIVLLVLIITCVISLVCLPKPTEKDEFIMLPKYQLFLMMLPALILVAIFSYLPLYGWRYAFFSYTPGVAIDITKDFVGLRYFNMLVGNQATRNQILMVMRNTLVMSAFGIFGQWIPMAFAIFLSEIRSAWFKRIVQTFTTIPNFISWVLVYTVAFALFSSDGFVSIILVKLHILDDGANFLLNADLIQVILAWLHFPAKISNFFLAGGFNWVRMWLWGMWKGLGWSAIIYIAAISGIDQELYEAATVDGAGRFRKMWHITVPGLLPTFFVLLLLGVAGILSNGMDQYYVFKNAVNDNYLQVLDLYTYTLGLGSSATKSGIPLSTLVGMLKSVISVILLFGANALSKALRGDSII